MLLYKRKTNIDLPCRIHFLIVERQKVRNGVYSRPYDIKTNRSELRAIYRLKGEGIDIFSRYGIMLYFFNYKDTFISRELREVIL